MRNGDGEERDNNECDGWTYDENSGYWVQNSDQNEITANDNEEVEEQTKERHKIHERIERHGWVPKRCVTEERDQKSETATTGQT